MAAARELFAEHGVGEVTTQVADRADVAIGTLYLYASTKAELLIMVQTRSSPPPSIPAYPPQPSQQGAARWKASSRLSAQWWACVREQVENGCTYLHELVFGDPPSPTDARDSPSQPDSRMASRALLTRDERIDGPDARHSRA